MFSFKNSCADHVAATGVPAEVLEHIFVKYCGKGTPTHVAKFQILSDLNGEIAWVSGPHYGSTGDGTLWGWYQLSWLHRADIVLADKAYQVLSPSTECVSDDEVPEFVSDSDDE